MPLTAPPLDNMAYADIVAQAKLLIPRYAPEWTNFNESDPGITLMELFAWMTEISIYRLNQVPDLNYIKFLQLIGIELKAAEPARAEVTFTLSRPDLVSVIVPQGTQIAASGGSETPVLFELDEALIAIGAQLSALQVFDGTSYSNVTGKNTNPGQWFYPFGQKVQTGSALLLGFSSPAAFPADQINLAVNLFADALTKPLLKSGAVIPPPATLLWEYWNGATWAAINPDSDGTRAFTQDGHILFPGPGASLKTAAIGGVAAPLYWIRSRVAASSYEMPPRLTAIRTNTAQATQALTFRDEVLGSSDGTPNQTFSVANTPVVELGSPQKFKNPDGTQVTISSVRLEVDEGQGFQVWQQVDDFFSSKQADRVYTFSTNTGVVTFGDGEFGKIPAPASAGNIVARTYRAGGGSQGNVGAGTITQIQTSVPSVSGVTNSGPATGGTDEETVADAKLRASRALKSNNRAVTAEDFETLAEEAPGANVQRACAMPLHHPSYPNDQIPGVVTVVVVPDSPDPNPIPNQTTLQAVCASLDQHRLLTSEVYVAGPVYRKVRVAVQLLIDPAMDLATVKNQVAAMLASFFHPLTGGSDGTGWPFGGTIYYSDVYRNIFAIDGVVRIQDNQLLIYLDDQLQVFCRDVAINTGELLYTDPQGHQIEVSYTAQ
jgi:predicted phage baseplate assembly protein